LVKARAARRRHALRPSTPSMADRSWPGSATTLTSGALRGRESAVSLDPREWEIGTRLRP